VTVTFVSLELARNPGIALNREYFWVISDCPDAISVLKANNHSNIFSKLGRDCFFEQLNKVGLKLLD